MTAKQINQRSENISFIKYQIEYYTMLLTNFRELCTDFETQYIKELNKQLEAFQNNPSLIYL